MAKKVIDSVIGCKIVEIRPMTKRELAAQGWDDYRGMPTVLVLDNGTKLFASQDHEGNGPGAIFGEDKKGEGFAY
jgi:hypothetical protein